jgi:hypothetical protein
MTKKVIAIAALAACVLSASSVSAFTVPTTSISARLVAGNSVKLFSPTSHGRSTLKMSAEVATEVAAIPEGESSDKQALFEPIGVGILRDYKARWPLLKSDFKDGLNVQVSFRLIDADTVSN